jgi:hypothetical protein
MPNEVRDLFDRWERVWHESQYELIPSCVGPNYIRHDENGDHTVTRMPTRKNLRASTRPDQASELSFTITHSRMTARGSGFRFNGLIHKAERSKAWPACRATGSRTGS